MPLVRIDLPPSKTAHYGTAVGDVVYAALVETMNVPVDDRFQIITVHELSATLDIHPSYLGIARSSEAIVIDITLNEGRSVELKKALYSAVCENLHTRLALRREDVVIVLTEVKKENWSFGNGDAPYAE